MKIFNFDDLLKNKIDKRITLAIGNFESLHRGHISLLEKLVKENSKQKAKACVLTFYNSPKEYLNKSKEKRVLDVDDRNLFFKKIKIDYIINIKFNKQIRELTAEKFLEILQKHLKITQIIIGENFRFGKNKKGNIKTLKKFSKKNKISLKIMPLKKSKNKIISSSLIKQLIRKGKTQELIFFLGRMYCIEGKRIAGKKIGKQQLYPTINIEEFKQLEVKEGIYNGICRIKGKDYLAVASYGTAPSFNDRKKTLEIHLINKKINILVNEKIKFYFFQWIRKNKKFKNINLLKKKIEQDINNTLQIKEKILKLRQKEKYNI